MDTLNPDRALLDLDSFVCHYVGLYNKADDETRSILPLAHIWRPRRAAMRNPRQLTHIFAISSTFGEDT